MPNRRLFLSGRRRARTRLRDLEIIQTPSPSTPETESVQTADSMGGLSVRRSSLRFRFLESFRRRSEAGTAMTIRMQTEIAAPLIEATGSETGAIAACRKLAQSNGWRLEADRVEDFISTPLREVPRSGTALHVGWHGKGIGVLSHDGSVWRWVPTAAEEATPVRIGAPGRLPPFIESLLPEGWLERILKPRLERERISAGRHYTSNIIVSENPDDLRDFPEDMLDGQLVAYTGGGAFAGGYAGPAPSFNETLEDRMAALYASDTMPRLSGVQIKAPMNLSHDGVLRPAGHRAFTHILKPSPGLVSRVFPWLKRSAWRRPGPAVSKRLPTRSSRCRTACPARCLSNASTSGGTATTAAEWRWRTWRRFAASRRPKNMRGQSSRWRGHCGASQPTRKRTLQRCLAALCSLGSSAMAIFT